ncbi:hypothetical protein I316_02307 [Kwoniella heveanensis BCC8398]|uniref:DUF676 domain-containing protein n=1 Tax=Kwoniella heveanensis BCC8398 TaxID=1296120 RepID=A0A1B9GXP9_9TREE|nr:hypothetical protein I316_02307 [Kwoniella heveanensis BCC8398]
MKQIIKESLESEHTASVTIISHSQGGLFVREIVKLIEKDRQLDVHKRKLEIYSIGSAAPSLGDWRRSGGTVDGGFSRVENFANSGDYVAQIGVLGGIRDTLGNTYIRQGGEGHLLFPNYLQVPSILARCTDSWLYAMTAEETKKQR